MLTRTLTINSILYIVLEALVAGCSIRDSRSSTSITAKLSAWSFSVLPPLHKVLNKPAPPRPHKNSTAHPTAAPIKTPAPMKVSTVVPIGSSTEYPTTFAICGAENILPTPNPNVSNQEHKRVDTELYSVISGRTNIHKVPAIAPVSDPPIQFVVAASLTFFVRKDAPIAAKAANTNHAQAA